jgi:hypothetical protein
MAVNFRCGGAAGPERVGPDVDGCVGCFGFVAFGNPEPSGPEHISARLNAAQGVELLADLCRLRPVRITRIVIASGSMGA